MIVGKSVTSIMMKQERNFPNIISNSLVGFVRSNSIVSVFFSSVIILIVMMGASSIINHGKKLKNIYRFAIPELNILGDGSGNTHKHKLLINKNIEIVK